MKSFLGLFAVIVGLELCAQDTGNVIPFQGQLANQAGQPLSPPAPSTLVFRLYRQAVGGIALWEESQPNISVSAARFSVLLGSRTELPAAPNFNTTLYLGITVDDGNPATADVEMRPRQAIVPVISASYAKLAQNAEKLNGFDWSALFGANNPNGTILGSKITAGTIASTQIAPHTIAAGQIAPSTITAAQIAANTITSSQIANRAIDLSNLAQQVLNKLVPAGTVVPFAGPQDRLQVLESSGWLLCDGRRVRKADYPDLWFMILDHWGQAEAETFILPDLRGVFLRGVDNSIHSEAQGGPFTGRDTDAESRQYWGGIGGRQVGTYQLDALQGHFHKVWRFNNKGTSGGYLPGSENGGSDSVANFSNPHGGIAGAPVSDGTNGVVRLARETRPKNVAVNYLIKY